LQEPGDPGDWYKFTAAAGETIRLNVNSLPTSLSGGFLVELNEAAGVLAVAQETGTLKTITVVANGSGVYYVHITALPGIQVGYALSLDILPAASVLFGFVDQINVPLNTVVVSNGIPISGISAPMPITITGGEYEINNSGLWTSTGGMVKNGDVVGVRQTSAFQYSTTTETVLDIGGVSGTFRVTTLADNPPPTVVITSPLSGLTNNNRPLLTYTASAGTVVVTVDGVVVSKVSGDVIDALVDGMHTVDVAVTDTSGRTGSASVTFTIDTLAPAVAISSPAAKLTNNETPLLSYTVSDGRVIVKVDGVVVNKVSGDLLDPIADGPHTVQVEATDAAGNVGISKVDFAVDTVPPAISINPVKSPKKDDDVTISGTREKGANIAVNVDTSAVVSPVLYKTETTWSCKIDGMVEGINTITAIAIDAAGNTASANVSILVK
jgi:hypothetical protein